VLLRGWVGQSGDPPAGAALGELSRHGAYLADRLRALKSDAIGEVRGRGLLIGLEMVADVHRTPMPEPEVIRLQRTIRDAGVLVGRNNDTVPGFGNVLTISPPLTLKQPEADAIVAAIGNAVAESSARS
jgi:4-aminobutyrate aminotransferase-like enzyme